MYGAHIYAFMHECIHIYTYFYISAHIHHFHPFSFLPENLVISWYHFLQPKDKPPL